jgi:ribonuclease P protein component
MFIVLCDSDVAHETSELQIGFVVSKKIGNAVRRHKHVRRLRSIFVEYMRKNPDYLNGCKSTYISFKYAEEYSDLASDFNKLFDRAGDYFKD